ncbi:UPF0715 family protein [Heyndrickxia oleronia]|uniref:UPF0715 family protein n=1 Tax=Heyndrickxia oleronia TaxID=38875 RepID=A0AAW6SRT4_9BACI|nr:UPF0715 family protein [Heyndrickxia oleronia]MDH5159522.1 UPF0715 family protein [Heyndrickxia oleronia]
MEIWKISQKVSALSEIIPYYFVSLFFSCSTLSLFIILYSGELDWLRLLPFIIYLVFAAIPYVLFAVPLQIILNKRPSKFSVLFLLYYILLSFIGVLLCCMVLNTQPIELVNTKYYYVLSIAAAVFYWFWDSVFLQKRCY